MNTRPLTVRCQILKTVAWLLVALPHSAVASMPIVLQEVDNAAQINQANSTLEQASLDLQQWQLEQLQRLHLVGHASWLEVAQQRVAVEQLAARNRATNQFSGFLAAIRPKIAASLATVKAANSRGSAESVRLFAPNSVRLVGWFEAGQVTPELANTYRQSLQEAIEKINDLEFRDGKSNLATEHLDANHAASAQQPRTMQQQRADLQLAINQAELALATAKSQGRALLQRRLKSFEEATKSSTLSRHPNGPPPSELLARAGTPMIDARASDGLMRAVSNVIRAEASAEGKKQALELAFERQTTRVTALVELGERGFASRQELQQAKDEQRRLECEIKLVELRHETHARVCRELADEIATTQALPDATPVESLPREVLCHATAVRHLLQLRHAQFASEAAGSVARIQLAMLKQQFSRLQRIVDQGAGQPGELKQHRLAIRECEANGLAAREQLVVLRQEERRFLEQFTAQHSSASHDWQTAGGDLLDGSEWIRHLVPQLVTAIVTVNRVDHVWRAATPGIPISGYFERPTVLESDLSASVWDALNSPASDAYSTFSASLWKNSLGLRPGFPARSKRLFSVERCSLDEGPPRSLVQFVPFELCHVYPGLSTKPSSTMFRSRLPHYAAEYAFGIRRLDSPTRPAGGRRATAYGGPWFLPGSPNNFRY